MTLVTLMKKRSATLLAVVAALLSIAPVQTQAARNFFWKVDGPGGTLYLVGSIHLLSKDYYPLSPALETAFKDSDLLVEEADLAEMEAPESQFKLLMRGLLPANQSLEKVVSRETYAMVSKRVAALGIPLEPLSRFKPWMLAMTLVEMGGKGELRCQSRPGSAFLRSGAQRRQEGAGPRND